MNWFIVSKDLTSAPNPKAKNSCDDKKVSLQGQLGFSAPYDISNVSYAFELDTVKVVYYKKIDLSNSLFLLFALENSMAPTS